LITNFCTAGSKHQKAGAEPRQATTHDVAQVAV